MRIILDRESYELMSEEESEIYISESDINLLSEVMYGIYLVNVRSKNKSVNNE